MSPSNACLLISFGCLPLLHGQEFRSFIGSNNTLWESPGNWNPNLVPDSISEGANLKNSSIVILGSDIVISALELEGAGGINLNQSNQLTTSTLVWSAGGLSGPGTLRVVQSGTINANSGATIASSTFRNDGTINLGRSLTLSAGAVIENNNTIELVDGGIIGTVLGNGPSIGVINNAGFLRKSSGAGNATLSSHINNSNGISCHSGTLIITQGGTSSGNFVTGPDGTLDINGDFILADGATIFGEGDTEISGSLTLDPGASVTLTKVLFNSTGGINGAGFASLQGPDHVWGSGGAHGGSSISTIESGSTVTVTATSGNSFSMGGTAGLIIQPNATLLFPDPTSRITSTGQGFITNRGLIEFNGGGDLFQSGTTSATLQTLTNEAGGIILKSGADGSNATQIFASIESAGELRIETGELWAQRDNIFTGPIIISPGAAYRTGSNSSTLTLDQGSSVSGGGAFVHAGAEIIIPAGARVPVSGYESLFSGGSVSGEGTFVFATDTIGPRLTHTGPGVTEIPVGVKVSQVDNFDLDEGRTLRVLGELDLEDTSAVTATNGATIDNQGSISFLVPTRIDHGGGTFAINNTGHLRFRAPGTGTVSLPADEFTGNGLVTIESGKLNLTRPVTASGTFELLANTELRGINLILAADSILKGIGTLNGTFTLGGSVQPGLSIGTLTQIGNSTFTGTGSYLCELGNGSNDLLDISNDLDLGGARLQLSLTPGYTPTPGTTWTIAQASNLTGTFSAVEQPTVTPGFGFFVTQTSQAVTITYSAIDDFKKVYAAFSGTDGSGPGINTFADEDLDHDGLPNLLEWAFGGQLSTPDSGRRLSLLSITPGNPTSYTLRYPLNPLATDVALTMESSTALNGIYTTRTMTPDGTVTEGAVTYQLVTVSIPASASHYFRIRARITP